MSLSDFSTVISLIILNLGSVSSAESQELICKLKWELYFEWKKMGETGKKHFKECLQFTSNNISNVTNNKTQGAKVSQGPCHKMRHLEKHRESRATRGSFNVQLRHIPKHLTPRNTAHQPPFIQILTVLTCPWKCYRGSFKQVSCKHGDILPFIRCQWQWASSSRSSPHTAPRTSVKNKEVRGICNSPLMRMMSGPCPQTDSLNCKLMGPEVQLRQENRWAGTGCGPWNMDSGLVSATLTPLSKVLFLLVPQFLQNEDKSTYLPELS